MKKYFETPEIEMTALTPDTDVMAASANLVNKKNTNLSTVEDASAASTEIWTGAGGAWL